jgi:hypothetical protein
VTTILAQGDIISLSNPDYANNSFHHTARLGLTLPGLYSKIME